MVEKEPLENMSPSSLLGFVNHEDKQGSKAGQEFWVNQAGIVWKTGIGIKSPGTIIIMNLTNKTKLLAGEYITSKP